MMAYRNLLTAVALPVFGACQPVVCTDDPDVRAEVLGPALAEVMTDSVLTCEEHGTRSQYNVCPDVRPAVGPDGTGVTWTPDRFLGFLPNPFHWPLDCYRGTSAELGFSSYQCCYDGDRLVATGPSAGSFDFVYPYLSPLTAIWHYFLDILPPSQCAG